MSQDDRHFTCILFSYSRNTKCTVCSTRVFGLRFTKISIIDASAKASVEDVI